MSISRVCMQNWRTKEFHETSSRTAVFAEALLPSYISVNQISCMHVRCKPGNLKICYFLLFKIDVFCC